MSRIQNSLVSADDFLRFIDLLIERAKSGSTSAAFIMTLSILMLRFPLIEGSVANGGFALGFVLALISAGYFWHLTETLRGLKVDALQEVLTSRPAPYGVGPSKRVVETILGVRFEQFLTWLFMVVPPEAIQPNRRIDEIEFYSSRIYRRARWLLIYSSFVTGGSALRVGFVKYIELRGS